MKYFNTNASLIPDIENGKDFYQYYKGNRRWIGLRYGGQVIPAQIIERGNDTFTRFNMRYFTNPAYLDEDVTWSKIKETGVFGVPLIGNHPFGASYIHISKIAGREAAKGLSLNEYCRVEMPDKQGFGLSNYSYVLELGRRKTDITIPDMDFFRGLEFGYYGNCLRHIYEPTYMPVFQALTSMLNGEFLGVALNHNLGFNFVRKDPKIHIMLNAKSIGYLEDENPRNPSIKVNKEDRFLALYLRDQFGTDARITM